MAPASSARPAAAAPEPAAEDAEEAEEAEGRGRPGRRLPGAGRSTSRGVTGVPAATDAEAVATLSGLARTLPCPIMSAACSTASPEVGTLPPNAWTPEAGCRPVAEVLGRVGQLLRR